jgi:hypothetical protein
MRSDTLMARKQAKAENKAVPPIATAEQVRAVRLELPLELHKQFRIEAAKEDTSMAAIARRLVEEWMAKRKTGGK